jgi:nitrogen fixation protein FixH
MRMQQRHPRTAKPIRSLWPCAIAGYFAVAIIGIAIFMTWAVRQNMDLVRPDYYEHEILFQKQIDAVNRTHSFAGELTIAYDFDKRSLHVRVPAAHLGKQFNGQAHLYRPSDARLDQRIDLKPGRDGTQAINAAHLAPGLWKVRLDWTANGESFVFEQPVIIGG